MFTQLIDWSKKNYFQLIWRKKRSLYHTLVSEIMLQQTTVATVTNKFERFIHRFPNLETLAQSTEEEVMVEWKGLGYYRRAKKLRLAAQYLVENFKGEIPLDYNILIEIPGIGDYTASALLSIGHDQPILAIDANINRVLSRIFLLEEEGSALKKELMEKAEKFLKVESPRELNEALMDLGRVYCQVNKVECHLCPVNKNCLAFKNKVDPLKFPVTKKKKTDFQQLELVRFIIKDAKGVLCYKKKKEEWLAGQWELPTFILNSQDEKLKQYPRIPQKKILKNDFDFSIKTNITKYKITNFVYTISLADFKKSFPDFYEREVAMMAFHKKENNFSTTTLKILGKSL